MNDASPGSATTDRRGLGSAACSAEPVRYESCEQVRTGVGGLLVRRLGRGPAVLLWHSMLVDSDQWSRIVTRLARERTVLLVDGPGHGGSGEPPKGYTLADCADAAAEVLDWVGVPRLDWVGNAWGGHVGIVFARRYPDRCRSLVAIATPTIPLTAAERLQTRLLASVYGALGPVAPLRKAICDTLVAKDSRVADPGARAVVAAGFARAARRGMRRSIQAQMLRRPDISAQLSQVPVPTLLLAGEKDAMWLPELAAKHAAVLPDGRVGVIAGAHRLPPLEQPDAVLEALAEFWSSISNRSASSRPSIAPSQVPDTQHG